MREHKKTITLFISEYGRVTVFGLLSALTIILCFGIYKIFDSKNLSVSFLDVGQGDSILVSTPSGHHMLIDGGPNNKVMEEIFKTLPYFEKNIDVMIATHGDADHVTGLIPIMTYFDIKKIVSSPVTSDTKIFQELTSMMEKETEERYVGAKGDIIDFGDGVVANILYPSAKNFPRSNTNDASVCVLVTYGEHSFLLTGDLSSIYESQLITKNLPTQITVYKAGHHGSKYSSGEQLLSYIHPEYSVISAGKDNKYGHPNKEAVGRLEKYSKEILSTIDYGRIKFISDGANIKILKER